LKLKLKLELCLQPWSRGLRERSSQLKLASLGGWVGWKMISVFPFLTPVEQQKTPTGEPAEVSLVIDADIQDSFSSQHSANPYRIFEYSVPGQTYPSSSSD